MSAQHEDFKRKLKISEASRNSTRSFIDKFNQMQQKTDEKLTKNPFSDTYQPEKFDRTAKDYGRPTPGSKTEARGIRAGNYVSREIVFLCETIQAHAKGTPPDCTIKFGPLFYLYSTVSDKLVGMLLRARKYGLVDFEGEMLYQRQDDHKEIRLLKTAEEIRQIVAPSGDPANCISVKSTK